MRGFVAKFENSLWELKSKSLSIGCSKGAQPVELQGA
jgi:hypothetical protein